MATRQDPRVKEMLAGIPKSKMKQATQLAESAAAIDDKLNESRKKIWNDDIVIAYDNGGGQIGERENPAYKAYASLLSSYQKVINQLDSMREDDGSNSKSMFDWNK